MEPTTTIQQLTERFLENESQRVELQQNLLVTGGCPSTDHSGFFTQTLAALQQLSDIGTSNTQLRELHYYRTRMLKELVTKVSAQLARFKLHVQAQLTARAGTDTDRDGIYRSNGF